MSIFGFGMIFFSVVVMAQIVGAAIGTLITSASWYRKWLANVTLAWSKDISKNYNKMEANGSSHCEEKQTEVGKE